MSRHQLATVNTRNVPVIVVAGFDRPLRSLFLSVRPDEEKCDPALLVEHDEEDEGEGDLDESTLYFDSLICGMRPDIEQVAQLATRLGLALPLKLLQEIARDAANGVGNRVVQWEGSSILSDRLY